MDEGWTHPCLELGDGPEHRLLAWAGGRVNKNGLVKLGRDKVFFQAKQQVRAGEEAFTHLEDAGWIERVTIGESFRWRILVRCCCSCFCFCGGENHLFPGAAGGSVGTMRSARSTGATPPVYCFETQSVDMGSVVGVKYRTVEKSATTVYLSKYLFPQLMRGAGIEMNPLQINGAALTNHLNRWKLQGIDFTTMKRMMEEFARHPEWCRGARVSPWRVFVGRRGELASLVASNQRRHPGNNRNKDWLAYPTRRTSFNYAT
jgi:hypothetical protein